MSRIRILPEELSNRIAAGEVIERPASVVKELAENAIDAGATRIVVHIERGGRSLIRVVDDGVGMDSEDALLCFEAHATSKLRTPEDLERIVTLGFRGEALPSIASVSRFTCLTRQAEAEAGTKVVIEGGTVQVVESVGCAPGTSMTVANLFYNTPARRKFLRTVATEESHIQELVLALALANPDIAFELTFDERQIFAVQPRHDLRTRATMLLGRDLVSSMLPVDYTRAGIHVEGLVARPGLTRTSRREQRTFLNRRAIEADVLYYAIRDAYHTLVVKGRFPPVLLFLAMDPDRVDVNVHPAKREVRFHELRLVGDVVAEAIRDALRRTVQSSPYSPGPTRDLHLEPMPPPAAPAARQVALPNLNLANVNKPTADDRRTPLPEPPPPPPTPSVGGDRRSPTPEPAEPPEAATPPPSPAPPHPASSNQHLASSNQNPLHDLRLIGQLGTNYLLAEAPAGLVLIDQRAAHERILFEQLLARAKASDGAGQGLLIPVTLDLSPADTALLRQHLEALVALGFEIEAFGANTFIIHAVPPHFPQQNLEGLVHDLLDDLRDRPANSRRGDERLLAASACRAAVRASDQLTQQEIDRLLADLGATELPYSCPRGRPTMINLSWQELEKRFGRRD